MTYFDEIQKNEMFNTGLEILQVLTGKGYDAFFVGGCVRDLVLGVDSHDVDISTNAPMELLEELFECHDIGQSKDFGILMINLGEFTFEVAQFRVDIGGTDGRHPDEVRLARRFQDDVKRRDLTINALGMDKYGRVIDFVGGLNDIKDGVIRTVGDPVERFKEDHLRILRAVRFAARFDFDIEDVTFAAIRTLRNDVDLVAKERVKDELFKMSVCDGETFADTIELLDRCRLLEVILPEVKRLQDVQEEPRFHPEAYILGDGTSYDHTLAAVRQNDVEDALTNLTVLFHDLGKGITHELDKGRYPEYRHRFHGHDGKGADVVGDVADRLRFSTEEKEIVVFCARSHMSIFHCTKMKKSTAAKYATNTNWPYLKQVMFCDDSCRIGNFNSEKYLFTIKTVEQIGRDYQAFNKNNNDVKLVNGKDVMEITGLKQGKEIGRIIDEVTEKFLDADEFVCLRKLIKDAVK